ncbi:hypothetical protein ACFLRB_01200 [Acidobacteriota bacterium]
MKKKITFMIYLLFFLTTGGQYLFPCTVFYGIHNDILLGGNNEDWSDPNTMIWFIPPGDGKHGWIKFGFRNGFPQGGMNEKGLFWDGTAGPHLEMPYSEANKEKYFGPLMEKVIRECATVDEALDIFSKFYCEDQYKAQYLVGDSGGTSVIVEGDGYILKNGRYQVLTNFYQSNPSLGGYPCQRYDTAVDMLENNKTYSIYLFGSILSATHQDGKYPTQYSNIYDLKKGVVYLFYYHNFNEFVEIDLKHELTKGHRSYDLPLLFSKTEMLAPLPEIKVTPSQVIFKWKGRKNSNYDLYYSTDSSFSDSTFTRVTASGSIACNPSTPDYQFLLMGVLFMGGISFGKKKKILALLLTALVIFLFFNCKTKETEPPVEETIEFSQTANNLQSNSAYYWKIVSHPAYTTDFYSETIVQTFYTGTY